MERFMVDRDLDGLLGPPNFPTNFPRVLNFEIFSLID